MFRLGCTSLKPKKEMRKDKDFENIKSLVKKGGLIAITGVSGSGKTSLLRRLKESLLEDNKTAVSKCLAVNKAEVEISTLYIALFLDLGKEENFRMPSQPDKREAKLKKLIEEIGKPVVLLIDNAHDLPWRTLESIKELLKTFNNDRKPFTVVLAGHPELIANLKKAKVKAAGICQRISL